MKATLFSITDVFCAYIDRSQLSLGEIFILVPLGGQEKVHIGVIFPITFVLSVYKIHMHHHDTISLNMVCLFDEFIPEPLGDLNRPILATNRLM